MKTFLCTCVALSLTAFGCASEKKADEPSKVAQFEQALSKTNLSLKDAIAAARAAQPGGTVIDADLEVEDGPAVFAVVVVTAEGARELKVDIGTGQVIDTQPDDGEGFSDCALGVSLEQAIDAAEREAKGRAVEVEIESCQIGVNVYTDRSLWAVSLGSDGSIIGVQRAVDDDEDDDGDDDGDDD